MMLMASDKLTWYPTFSSQWRFLWLLASRHDFRLYVVVMTSVASDKLTWFQTLRRSDDFSGFWQADMISDFTSQWWLLWLLTSWHDFRLYVAVMTSVASDKLTWFQTLRRSNDFYGFWQADLISDFLVAVMTTDVFVAMMAPDAPWLILTFFLLLMHCNCLCRSPPVNLHWPHLLRFGSDLTDISLIFCLAECAVKPQPTNQLIFCPFGSTNGNSPSP